MKEREELKTKNAMFRFIREHMDFVGDPEKIDDTVRGLVEGLYSILFSDASEIDLGGMSIPVTA